MRSLASELVIHPVLIRKHDARGARDGPYPPADRFVEAFGEAQLRQWLEKRNIGGFSLPLAVYVHLPASGRVALTSAADLASYFRHLQQELRVVEGYLDGQRRLSSLRWGGAVPPPQFRLDLAEAMRRLGALFELDPQADIAVQADPRTADPGYAEFLATLGFNALSVRIRGGAETRRLIEEARDNGFRAVSLELPYGTAHQTLNSLSEAIERAVELQPDRIELFRPARAESGEGVLQALTLAVGRLARAGYGCTGIDQFSRSADSRALQPEADVLGFGPAAIGRIGPTYYQNFQRLADYGAALDAGRLPVRRGIELTADDLLRRSIIQSLRANFRVSIEAIEIAHLVDFRGYFAAEMEDLRALETDGLVEIQPDWIIVTASGRLLVRAVCQVFDRYLRARREATSYSRVI